MANTIKIKRGVAANLPTLNEGELALTTDNNDLYVGTSSGNVRLNTDYSSNINSIEESLNDAYDKFEDYYTKDQTNEQISDALNGFTFADRGVNNLLRNSAWLYMTDGYIDYWNVEDVNTDIPTIEENVAAMSGTALLLNDSYISQSVALPNNTYTISFNYEQRISSATASIMINGTSIALSGTNEFKMTVSVETGYIEVKFISDTKDSFAIYDLMLNTGTEKAPWAQNLNEGHSDLIKLSRELEAVATERDLKVNIGKGGLEVTNTKTLDYVLKTTDDGITTTEITSAEGTIAGMLIKKVGDQTWLTGV